MTTRCLSEWDESTFEVFVSTETGFDLIGRVYSYDVFHVAQKLARQIPAEKYDDIHFIRASIPGFWVITFEHTADCPDTRDQIIAEFYVRKA